MPKCGSSALQVFFANNITNLKKEGIDYFDIEDLNGAKQGEITSGNGAFLSRSMLGEKHEAYYSDNGVVYGNFLNSVKSSECSVGLLSSEFFAVVPFKNIEMLKNDLLSFGVNIKFIYYVRKQEQFLMSSYMQRVKRHGFTGMPEDFIIESYQNIHFLKYFGYANGLENHIGKGNVLPFNYDDTREYKNGLVGHFMNQILGFDAQWIDVDPVINVSPNPVELKMMLIANQFGARPQLSDFLVQDSVLSGRGGKFRQHAILHPDLKMIINKYFNEQNSKFEEKFNIKFAKLEDKEFVDLETLEIDQSTMVSVLMGLIVRLDRRLAGGGL